MDFPLLFITEEASESDITRTGAKVVTQESFGDVKLSDLSTLESDKLIAALHKFKRIGSIDFFGHSSPWGALLESQGDNRTLGPTTPVNIALLKDNFARDVSPYVMLHGCNGGVTAASFLSKVWQVPVGGALTGSNFQTLRSDGRWYFNDEGFFPPATVDVTANDKSFGPEITPACANGACVRMKPQDSPYRGVWANPETGFRSRSATTSSSATTETPRRPAPRGWHGASTPLPRPGPSSEEELKEVLADFFCSGATDPAFFDGCNAGLFAAAAGSTAFSPMKSANDYSLECDFAKCEQKFRCEEIGGQRQKKTCAWSMPAARTTRRLRRAARRTRRSRPPTASSPSISKARRHSARRIEDETR